MAAYDVVTCGEPMVLFSAGTAGPLRYVGVFRKYAAGAELNFSIGLARLGLRPGYITRVGDDEFGHYILACMRVENLDTSLVKVDPERPTGVYFKEYRGLGDPQVYYYRRGSAASALSRADIDPTCLEGARLVHLTGITPVLSPSCWEAAWYLVELAGQKGVPVSFDPNVRLKLVPRDRVRDDLLPFVTRSKLLLLNEFELEVLFGTRDLSAVADQIFDMGPEIVVLKMGVRGAVGMMVNDRRLVEVEAFRPARFLDPVGAGDGFDAGFVFGYLNGWPLEACLRLGNYVGASATAVLGDYEGYPYYADLERAGLINGALRKLPEGMTVTSRGNRGE